VKSIKNWYFVAFAFLLYCFYNFFYLPPTVTFGDETRFISEAVHFANTGEFRVRGDKAWEMPLVGSFYGIIYYMTGSEEGLIYSVRFLQSLMLILQAFLISKITMIIFKDRLASKIAFVWILFYPFLVYYQGLLLSETIFITFLIASFYYLYKWQEDSFKGKNLYLFLTFSIFALYAKATTSFLVPLVAPIFFFLIKRDFTRTIKVLFISILFYIALLSPWWIRNYILLDTFVPFTTSNAMNLYLGNNPGNKYGGCDWRFDVEQDKVTDIRGNINEVERNRAFNLEAKKFISENPQRFFELAWLKLKRFYSLIPNADGFKDGIYKWITIATFGPVLVFTFFGMLIGIRYTNKLLPIYLLIVYFTLIHSIIISSLRYRLPIEPFMVVIAAFGISYIYKKVKNND